MIVEISLNPLAAFFAGYTTALLLVLTLWLALRSSR